MRLRPDICVTWTADGPGHATDPLLDRVVPLSLADRRVLENLANKGVDKASDTATLGSLKDRHLLWPLAHKRLTRARRVQGLLLRAAPSLRKDQLVPSPGAPSKSTPLEFQPGARWSCQATGACCQRFVLGPLIPHDQKKMAAYRWPPSIPLPAGEAAITRVRVPGTNAELALLARRDGHCVFLGSDHLCQVHKHLGAQHKPLVCRLFPFRFVSVQGALRVTTSVECAGLETQEDAPTVEVYDDHIRELLAEVDTVPQVPSIVDCFGHALRAEALEAVDVVARQLLTNRDDAELCARLISALRPYTNLTNPEACSLEPPPRISSRHARTLWLDLVHGALAGAIAPNLLRITGYAYERAALALRAPAGTLERVGWKDYAKQIVCAAMAATLFGKEHLRAPDAGLGVAALVCRHLLGVRLAALTALREGNAVVEARHAIAALRDLAPGFEAASGLRTVLYSNLLGVKPAFLAPTLHELTRRW